MYLSGPRAVLVPSSCNLSASVSALRYQYRGFYHGSNERLSMWHQYRRFYTGSRTGSR